MKKQFSVRARLQIYLERTDFDKVTELARGRGMLVAEFVREKLLAGLERTEPPRDKGAIVSAAASVPYDGGVSLPETKDKWLAPLHPGSKIKTCKHGKQKGYHCWQCGGLAVIE